MHLPGVTVSSTKAVMRQPSGTAIVFIHGLFSTAKVWREVESLVTADSALAEFDVLQYEYTSWRFNFNPRRRIPDFNVLADGLGTFLSVRAADYKRLVLVSHSQGGLIVQRYLSRMLHGGRGE